MSGLKPRTRSAEAAARKNEYMRIYRASPRGIATREREKLKRNQVPQDQVECLVCKKRMRRIEANLEGWLFARKFSNAKGICLDHTDYEPGLASITKANRS